ncbi:MAG: cytochrome ubiquinol oxidase subunit I [Thermoplasmata archaeon]
MNSVFDSFILLGYAVIGHLFLVNLILGISILVPIIEYIQIKRKDDYLKSALKKIFKFMVISDLFAGVWATWITVFLGGFWPLLTFYATTILFIPITISIIGILIALPSIGIYWFTWDKIKERTHLLVGIIMAIGTIMVPIGFNMIFSFIDYPYGMQQALNGSLYYVFGNPLYPDFTLHRIFGSLTMVSLMMVGIYSYLYWKKGDEKYRQLISLFLYISIPTMLIESFLGFIYAWELNQYSPYIASVLFGPFSSSGSENSLFYLFVIFIIIISLLWILLLISMLYYCKGKKLGYTSLALSILSLFAIPLGEFLNDYSRYPYFIITGDTGIKAENFLNGIMQISDIWVYSSIIISLALLSVYLWLVNRVIIKEKSYE